MDYYLNPDNCYQRLENEFIKHGKLIIACDWDDTLYNFHKINDRTYNNLIGLLRRWENYAEIIIFTANGENKYNIIKEYCNKFNIPYNGINCDSTVKVKGRKIYANVYLDDRAGLPMTYDYLLKLINKIEEGKLKNV